MTEFNTDVNTLSLNADFQASDKLSLRLGALYSNAEAEWEDLNITTPSVVTDPVMTTIYDISAVNVIADYSDLEYEQTEVSLGGTYQFTPAFYVAANAQWQQFEDKSPYVYGDQDGEMFQGNLGLGYKF